jgi:tripartite ATP-independent transporter DctM subunit
MGTLALLVFLVIVFAILSGYPVAISLGGVSLVAGYILLGPAFMQFLPSRIVGVLSNYVLLAVPMFIVMGLALQRSGLAESLMKGLAKSMGGLRGGLAIAVLLVGALLAASTGIVGASVVTLGLIAFPVMQAQGYDARISTGIIASAGSLGQIIPPSIVLVLLGSVMQVSVGGLFSAAIWPSVLIVGLYGVYILFYAFAKPELMPPGATTQLELEEDGKDDRTPPLWLGVGGPLLLIIGVLGSILLGAASPTEASGLGAVVSLGLLAASGRWSWNTVLEIGRESLRLTSMIFLILLGATTFALVFRGLEGDHLLVSWVTESGLSASTFVLILLLVVFIAGFFIDFIEIIFIVVPVVLPLVHAYGIDPMWLAVLLGINLQTSFLTPPFGFSLFYLRGVVPETVPTSDVYRGVIPFVLIQVVVLGIVFYWGSAS